MALISQMGMSAFWLVAMVVLLVVEGMAPGLVSIWFALGALAALISSLLKAPVWLQVLWFFVVSLATLLITRPLAKKYVNAHTVHTNADMAIGQDCVVTEAIDNVAGTGAVSVGGKIWTARMAEKDGRAEKGAVLRAVRIEGVKLIVEEKKEAQN
ncbi:MAG: NfeD family protein [Oscillospiraceae bacterium]|nr:NfeD family protein [Oscillospiraceae bacterium]